MLVLVDAAALTKVYALNLIVTGVDEIAVSSPAGLLVYCTKVYPMAETRFGFTPLAFRVTVTGGLLVETS